MESSTIQINICCGNHPIPGPLTSSFFFLLFKLIKYFLQGCRFISNSFQLPVTCTHNANFVVYGKYDRYFTKCFSQNPKESLSLFNIEHHTNHCWSILYAFLKHWSVTLFSCLGITKDQVMRDDLALLFCFQSVMLSSIKYSRYVSWYNMPWKLYAFISKHNWI